DHHLVELEEFVRGQERLAPPWFCTCEPPSNVLMALAILCQCYLAGLMSFGDDRRRAGVEALLGLPALGAESIARLADGAQGLWGAMKNGLWWLSHLAPQIQEASEDVRVQLQRQAIFSSLISELQLEAKARHSKELASTQSLEVQSAEALGAF